MDFASSVPDFRRAGKGNIRHRLADIIMLMILGRASGHVGRSEIIAFGSMREFAETYHARLLKGNVGMEIICVDGKAERGTVMDNGSSPDIVSAYSPSSGITLATEACHEKSNVIKAVTQLLDTIQRIVHSVFSIWRRLRKKKADRRKRMAELMRHMLVSFTKLIRFLLQK